MCNLQFIQTLLELYVYVCVLRTRILRGRVLISTSITTTADDFAVACARARVAVASATSQHLVDHFCRFVGARCSILLQPYAAVRLL